MAYDKSNSLAENAMRRVRPLAMHQLHGRRDSASDLKCYLAIRHHVRFSLRGAAAYELAFGRVFADEL